MGKPFMEPKEVKGLGLDDYYVEKRQKKEEAEAQQDMQLTQQDAHAKMAKDLSIELDEVDMQLFKHEFLGVVVVVTVAYVVIFAFAFSLGVNGFSTEQCKSLTIAVQLVAKLSIIFIVEPNSGLDALAAAIVMRTIRNTIDRGRTIVRTIHHPIIDIFKPLMRFSLKSRRKTEQGKASKLCYTDGDFLRIENSNYDDPEASIYVDLILDSSAGDWPIDQAELLAYLALRSYEKDPLNQPNMLSEDVMKDPHIAADAYTYEGTAIKGWMYSGHDNSPATNLKLDTCDLIPNYPRYCTIQEW
ncbi:hypothetical protein FXO38_12209 [Capsicum annuum]|nr:hypothetical protein FXO38_12209 [Capsicum annuum]